MRTRGALLTLAGTAMFLGAGTPAIAATPTEPLPVGTTASGSTSSEAPARFQFSATASGVLTVAVVGEGDLRLTVIEADGTPLPDGRIDRDLMGNLGLEQGAVSIPRAGDYIVNVEVFGSSTFEIGATFLEIGGRDFAPDADGPTRDAAIDLAIGESHVDDEVVFGDQHDWFRLVADDDGTLVVTATALEIGPWLALEVSDDEESDFTFGSGNPATAVFDVSAGDVVFVRLSAGGSPAGGYSLLAEYGEPDPDGTIDTANVLEVGAAYEDTDSAPSDREDWFAITAPRDGTLTVTTSALGDVGPDLQLEFHRDGTSGWVEYSDNDIDGDFTAESLTIEVSSGQTVFIRVGTYSGAVPTNYRIVAELS